MHSLFTFVSPPDKCAYLPEQLWQLRYEVVGEMSASDYAERLYSGWRRFGYAIFRPECPECTSCQTLRVDVAQFRPNQSQRRAWKQNVESVRLVIGPPSVSQAKLDLYDRYHQHQAGHRGWRLRANSSIADYSESFVDNPFPTEEWCYYLEDKLVGVGYVDPLPIGLSAIYFFHDPELRSRSLGTFNVLKTIESAQQQQLPHVYLGYYVEGCQSLQYKKNFRPNEVFSGSQGQWLPFVR